MAAAEAFSANQIHPGFDRLQVPRIHTGPHAAEVVDY